MKLHQLRDFIAVAQAGGVRAAARQLGLSQPSLTKSIQLLEAELGTPLFERTPKGIALNAFGEAFLLRAQRAAHELRRGEDEIHQLRGAKGGHVAIAVSGTPALRFLSGALRTFRRRYPDASVRIVEALDAATVPALREGALDFAVLPQRAALPGSELDVETIFQDRRAVVGRRGHPLRGARTLAELQDASWVVTGAAGPRDVEFDAPFIAHGLPVPRADVHCESLIALLALVASSDLLVLLPRQWLQSPVTESLLEEIPVRERIDVPAICLVRRSGLPLTPAADALASAMTIEARDRERLGQASGKRKG